MADPALGHEAAHSRCHGDDCYRDLGLVATGVPVVPTHARSPGSQHSMPLPGLIHRSRNDAQWVARARRHSLTLDAHTRTPLQVRPATPPARSLPSRPRQHAGSPHGGGHARHGSAPQRAPLGYRGRPPPPRRPPGGRSGAASGAQQDRFSRFQVSRFPHTSRCAGLSAAGWGRRNLAIWKPVSLPGAPRAPSERTVNED